MLRETCYDVNFVISNFILYMSENSPDAFVKSTLAVSADRT